MDDYVVIYTRRIRLKNGRTLYASACGLKAFRLVIPKSRYRA